MNNVLLIGNLVQDPKLVVITKEDGSILKVCNFCIATNRTWNGGAETTFVNCEAWDSGGEHIANNFKKGDRMFAQGSLKNETWEKDGQKHRRDKVRVNHFERVSISKPANDQQQK